MFPPFTGAPSMNKAPVGPHVTLPSALRDLTSFAAFFGTMGEHFQRWIYHLKNFPSSCLRSSQNSPSVQLLVQYRCLNPSDPFFSFFFYPFPSRPLSSCDSAAVPDDIVPTFHDLTWIARSSNFHLFLRPNEKDSSRVFERFSTGEFVPHSLVALRSVFVRVPCRYFSLPLIFYYFITRLVKIVLKSGASRAVKNPSPFWTFFFFF